jgi:hypothetical protein
MTLGRAPTFGRADVSDADNILRQTPHHTLGRDFTESTRASVDLAIDKDAKECLKTILSKADASDTDNVLRQTPRYRMERSFTESKKA